MQSGTYQRKKFFFKKLRKIVLFLVMAVGRVGLPCVYGTVRRSGSAAAVLVINKARPVSRPDKHPMRDPA